MSLRGLTTVCRCQLRTLVTGSANCAIVRPRAMLLTTVTRQFAPIHVSSISTSSMTLAKKGSDSKRGSKHKTHELSENELNQFFSLEELNAEIARTIEHLGQTYATQLALRSNVSSFENLPVSTSAGRHLLSHIAQITQKPQMVLIDVSAKPELVGDVKEAIEMSGMNVNPQQDGTSIFVPLPKVTKEHRDAMAKNAKVHADKVKEKLRQLGTKYSRTFKKNAAGRGEDFIKSGEETVQRIVKKFEQQVDGLMTSKQRELTGGQ